MRRFLLALAALPVVLCAGNALAGHVRGPQNKTDMVDAKGTDVYVMVFEAERLARVKISGDGSTDLDCYAYDGNENLVESDTDSTDSCILSWTPAWEGKFKIKIKNRGNIPNIYTISTN